MFMYHCAQFLGLIAIASGIMLIVWAVRNEGRGVTLAKVFGALIVIFALIGSICNSYYAITNWHKGNFEKRMFMTPQERMQQRLQRMQRMQNMQNTQESAPATIQNKPVENTGSEQKDLQKQ